MPRRIAMHAQPQRTLKRLIKQYGQELVDDPRRTEALLRDLCGQHPREIFVLINAQRLHVPSELQSAPSWLPYAAVQSRLTRQLQTKLALTEDAADWAVDTWAAALEIASGGQERSLPLGLGALLRGDQDAAPPAKRGAAKTGGQSGSTPRRSRRSTRGELHWRLPALAWPGWPSITWQRPTLRALALAGGLVAVLAIVTATGLWMARDEPSPINAEAAPAGDSAVLAAPSAETTPVVSLASLTLAEPGVYLREAWELPVFAQVTADGLFVREGPSVGYRDIAILQARRSVHVVGFSDDGVWSQIDQPRPGWVSNDFLQFETDDGASVRLQVRVVQARPYDVAVRSRPRAAADQIATLPAGSTAVAVGVTSDDGGRWLQIAQPAGWLTADDVMIVGSP